VLDSGSPDTVIDMALAKKLGMKMGGRFAATGAGSGTVPMATTRIGKVSLQGLDYSPPNAFAIELEPEMRPVEGRHVDGLIGGDLMSRTVMEIDYAHKLLNVRSPESYHRTGTGFTVPIQINQYMFAKGAVDIGAGQPTPCEFLIDTGDHLPLSLNSPFVAEHHLLTTRMPRQAVGSGIGGMI
jgi:hypothetical protein